MNEKQLLAKCQDLAAFLYFEVVNAIHQLKNGVPLEAVKMDAARLGRMGGLARSRAKATASAQNGKLGGRPKGKS